MSSFPLVLLRAHDLIPTIMGQRTKNMPIGMYIMWALLPVEDSTPPEGTPNALSPMGL